MEGGGVETAQCPGVGTVQQEQKDFRIKKQGSDPRGLI